MRALLGGGGITRQQAMSIPAVAGCARLIAQTISTVPINLYKDENGQAIPQSNDRRVRLLNDETGDILDGAQLKEAWVRDYLLEGAGYVYIERKRGKIESLHYVKNDAVSIVKNVDPIWKTADFYINGIKYRDFDFLKITQNSKDGVTGAGIVKTGSKILEAAYNLLKYEIVLAKTGGKKKGFVQSKTKLSQEAMEALKAAWRQQYSDIDNAEHVMILNNGLEFKDAGSTSVEMQLNESKRTNSAEICKLCGVPPAMLEGNVTEAVYRLFIKTAIQPILTAIEAACNKDLLLEKEKGSFYFAFDTKELLKGDTVERYQAYEIAARNGIMQIDEIRYRENMPPLGLDFIKLGLQDVLYNPRTKQIYTPNTDKASTMEAGEWKEAELKTPANRETELRGKGNPYHAEDGKFTTGPGDGLTNNEKNANLKSSENISAYGSNRFEKGFTEENLKKHWEGGDSDHSEHYPGWTKEQYAKRALELVQKPTGSNILGYKTKEGAVVRYDTDTNDYVKGYPGGGIATMFKPDDGIAYFNRKRRKEND